jgi:hypothetical protein
VTENTEKGDVWSLGMTFLHAVLLDKPTGINVKAGKRRLINYFKKTTRYPDIIRYVIFNMLKYEENERPTFAELLGIFGRARTVEPATCIADPTLGGAYPESRHETVWVDPSDRIAEVRFDFLEVPMPTPEDLA